ncbi:FkbM family methyltransferase [Rhodopirellula bahusiensis]|uniref:FkbM family methyltransferase n=1 Tax=Rhodopirellula bahusiensis TaxID=2014065 RepID=UPI0032638265
MLQQILMPREAWRNPVQTIHMKSGLQMSIDARNRIHWAALWTGRYDQRLIDRFCNAFSKETVVWDIGSNVGYYAIPFASFLKPIKGKVVAFEPLTENLICLKAAVKANSIEDIVSIQPFGLGEKNETVVITTTSAGGADNAVIQRGGVAEESKFKPVENIKVKVADEFYLDNGSKRVDFLKIDIEGYELFFLQGARRILQEQRPAIFGEFNRAFLKKFNYGMAKVWEILQPIGYDCYAVDTRKAEFKKLVAPSDNRGDYLFLHPEHSLGLG